MWFVMIRKVIHEVVWEVICEVIHKMIREMICEVIRNVTHKVILEKIREMNHTGMILSGWHMSRMKIRKQTPVISD